MRKPFIALCGAAALAFAGSGCVSLPEHESLKAQYSALSELNQRQKEEMGRKIALLETEKERESARRETADVRTESMGKELAAAKAIADEIRAKLTALVPPSGSSSDGDGGDIQVFDNYIRFSGEVLFDSGKAELKAQGKTLLLEVARELKSKGYYIEVSGHTDTDPIRRSIGKFPTGSNFELGAERALQVVLMLQKEGGIDAGKLHLSSWGEFQPAESGNKRKNRRVEIRFTATDPYVTDADRK